jgi:hypothetical protein
MLKSNLVASSIIQNLPTNSIMTMKRRVKYSFIKIFPFSTCVSKKDKGERRKEHPNIKYDIFWLYYNKNMIFMHFHDYKKFRELYDVAQKFHPGNKKFIEAILEKKEARVLEKSASVGVKVNDQFQY